MLIMFDGQCDVGDLDYINTHFVLFVSDSFQLVGF